MTRTRDDARAWEYARAHKLLITLDELRAAGFTRDAIAHRLRTGRLTRVFPGVYAVGPGEITRERLWLAATLAIGEGAALSHLTAAAHREIWEDDPPALPDVSIQRTSGRAGPQGITLHRPRLLLPTEYEDHDGIPTTTVIRTIIDCAGTLGQSEIRSMVRQAQRVHKLSLGSLEAAVQDLPTRSSQRSRLSRVLSRYLPAEALTRTEREARFLELCARHDLPLPIPQHKVAGYHPDFVWPHLRLIVELDDKQSHDTDLQFGDDRRRDRAYLAAGYTVVRFTVAELLSDPDAIGRELKAIIARLT